MCIELFCLCHQFYGMANTADTLFRELLEGYLSAIAVEIDSTICCGIAMCRQGVVSTAGIVACTLTGILSKEYTAGIYYLLCHLLVVLCLDDKMLWGIGV